ncbi:MAG TPA: aminopeptidase, partial [Candidatus Merdenecus merdavium]|nr:aminopeptidase [Candidatus Merdenecus merdavium]
MERSNAWSKYDQEGREKINDFVEGYKDFISNCKTERECVTQVIKEAKAQGYKDLDEIIQNGTTLKTGDKVYSNNMGKAIALFHIGTESIEKGMNILGAHIDSPRLDLKQNPLYEDTGLAMLDTHYYGGVKKYQWVTLPLALHGVVCKKDGTNINIVI